MSKPINTSVSFSFIIIVAAIIWSFISLLPQEISDMNAPEDEFSTARALVHLKEITKEPHFIGSEAHQDVRDYLVSELKNLGLNPEIQKRTVASVKWQEVSVPENIMVRIEGSSNSKALVIMSHYDSDPSASFGASDAGSGIVAILESLRAYLASGEKPKNDIIVLFTDSEEIGLNGALAFVRKHPWAKDVGLVLNFEARGSGGPAVMWMETNGGNQKMVEHFASAKPPYSLAVSLVYSVYKMLPNDTDLTVFKEQGDIPGFNFAFIDDHYDYHTAGDNYENLDRNTLEQLGNYAMPLLKYFAQKNLNELQSDEDSIYFNFPFVGLVHYPASWIMPMLIGACIVFLLLIVVGLSKKVLLLKSIGAGFLAFLLSLGLAGAFTFYGWKLISHLNPHFQEILHGFPYNGHFYILGFGLLSLFIFFWVYKRFFNKHNGASLFTTPLFMWLIINGLLSQYLDGGAFFIVPVIFGLITLGLLVFSNLTENKKLIIASILALPTLLVFPPFAQIFPVALGLKILFVTAVLTVLIVSLLIPILSYYNLTRLRYLFLAGGIIALIAASFQSNFNEERPRPNSLSYVLDSDKKVAYWTSYESEPDDWTKKFFKESYEEGSYDTFITPSKYSSGVRMHTNASIEEIPEPIIEVKKDTTVGSTRQLAFEIANQRKVHRLSLFSENDFKSMTINGAPYLGNDLERNLRKPNLVAYYKSGDEKVLVELEADAQDDIKIVLYESSHDLLDNPYFKVEPRPATMIPKPFILNDAIIVRKELNF